MSKKHRWQFTSRFRKGAFGWRSQLPVKRVKEATSEIKKVARKDPVLAAEGAVRFLEKVSPALEHVDSSSGAIGNAVNKAIEAMVPIIAEAPLDQKKRSALLERLWEAFQEDQIPYIETLGDYWGELCASPELASEWADRLVGVVKLSWSPDPNTGGFFNGTFACLSCFLAAGRNEELLSMLEQAPHVWWHYRKYGVRALVALGRKAEALRYAEASGGLNDSPVAIARACEEILLSSGLAEEAYQRYALQATRRSTYLATYRAIARKYPGLPPERILRDLAGSSPGEEGKWFAAAKDAKLFDLAVELANQSPCDPRTLTRAARDFAEENPAFAIEAGTAALRWLVDGYGYEITNFDVMDAYKYTMAAAENAGRRQETHDRLAELVRSETFGERFVTKVLGKELGIR